MLIILELFIVTLFIIYLIYLKNNKLICLMYHNVFINKTNGIISIEEFEQHMEYIKNKKTFKMEELENLNYKVPKNSILITFDDGYKNNYTNAFSILKKYGLKATIFLNTKYVGNDEYYLNWDEIKEMYKSGLIDFQMHTHSHSPVIRKLEIKGFFHKDEGQFVKREYYTLFDKNEKYKGFRNVDFTGLPVFKIRSQISILGYKLKENFLEKYRELEKNENLDKMDTKNKIKKLNKIFQKNKNDWFEKVDKNQFDETLKFEICENKKIIEKNLNKKVEYLAYPWGHKYKGNIKELEQLGVKGFVLTTEKINNNKINIKKITRINGDRIKEIEKFKEKLNKYM